MLSAMIVDLWTANDREREREKARSKNKINYLSHWKLMPATENNSARILRKHCTHRADSSVAISNPEKNGNI